MKMTIVTDSQGDILGAIPGVSMPEQIVLEEYQAHVVDVEDDIGAITDAEELKKRLQQHLQAQHGKQ